MEQLSKEELEQIEQEFDVIIKTCVRCRTEDDVKLVRKAFDLAVDAHAFMRRKSGEPYVTHPIAVAKIVAGEMELGVKSVICALLHDVVEDTDYTLNDIKEMFGITIANIIDGLTKISHVLDKDASLQAENFRKMLLTLSEDVRVIFIKLADRLHNMRTLDSMPEYKQIKIAGETLFLYAPLAHRLGLYNIKTELEDLALKYEHPLIYKDIQDKVLETEGDRNEYIKNFAEPIIRILTDNKVDFNLSGRPKSIFSIYNKMQNKDVPFEEIYDIFAVRIVFSPDSTIPEKAQCWNIYSLITDVYQPNPDRLRDWISTPKANGYEALHTTVMGHGGRWVEVQIRSKRMDDIAERGYAAHWKYKGDKDDQTQLDKWLQTVRKHLEKPSSDALDFLDEFKLNLFSSEIYVFTPKGRLERIPKGSTALDFAYTIHTEVGDKAIGAKVNHKLVPLRQKLRSGDQVEILTSDKQTPQSEWLDFVITGRAKSKIKSALKEERRYFIDKGQKDFIKIVRELNYPLDYSTFKILREKFDISNKEEFYRRIGAGLITAEDIEKMLPGKRRSAWGKYWRLSFGRSNPKTKSKDENSHNTKTLIIEENENEQNYRLANCCDPIPGDDVVGFLNSDQVVVIHKKNCPNAIDLMATFGDRIVSVQWKIHKILSFPAKLYIEGIDDVGMVLRITQVISMESEVNMKSIRFDSNDGIFVGNIDLYIHNVNDLETLISRLKKIKGIKKVLRTQEKTN
jgi:GTP diphosphokinase / guanosine-3',5'-bis(diphosphate) 3'-diphosphatase